VLIKFFKNMQSKQMQADFEQDTTIMSVV
jgi:hypothetical protein